MKTFNESLQITKNLAMLNDLFVRMSEKNIDPTNFVEWYANEGQNQEIFLESAAQWIQEEGMLRNAIGNGVGNAASWLGRNAGRVVGGLAGGAVDAGRGAIDALGKAGNAIGQGAKQGWNATNPQQPQNQQSQTPQQPQQQNQQAQPQPQTQQPQQQFAQHAAAASKAMDVLSARIGKSKTLQDKIGDKAFGSTIMSLKQMLDDPSKLIVQSQQPQNQSQQPQPQQNQAQPSSSDNIDVSFESLVDKVRLRNQIRTQLRYMQEQGLEPDVVANWYIKEGRYVEDWEGVKDWGKNLWANVKGAWDKWGEAGQKRQAEADAKRDSDAIAAALQSIEGLEKGMGNSTPSQEFSNALNVVKTKLTELQSQAQQADSQEDPTGQDLQPMGDDDGTQQPQQSQPQDPNQQTQPDYWDEKEVADLRAKAANNDPSVPPEIVQIHNDANLSDQEKHEKIASFLSNQLRNRYQNMINAEQFEDKYSKWVKTYQRFIR